MPYKQFRSTYLLLAPLILLGCATLPPKNVNDACAIFKEKDSWYADAHAAYEEHGVPVHVQMAIMHQESRFKYDAQPERQYLLGFIPWFRKSSAYGYAQVKDETWDWYRDKTGRYGADRDDFEDATRFIAWYVALSHQQLKISKWDTYNQYLAYHEGHGGYRRKTYNKKPWLKGVASKVKAQAGRYATQLKKCEGELDKGWDLWPF